MRVTGLIRFRIGIIREIIEPPYSISHGTAIESSDLHCYNTAGDRISVVSQTTSRMGWILLELVAEIGIEKRTIYNILRK